jgi:GNAT superfamily N-acetyltransferase
MDPMSCLSHILRLNTNLFRNCLDALGDDAAAVRPTTNSAAFVALHVTDARFFLLGVLGVEGANPLAPYVASARGIDDIKQFPPLAETLAAWAMAAHALRDRLEALTAADVDGPTTAQFPMVEHTMLGALTFLVRRYHRQGLGRRLLCDVARRFLERGVDSMLLFGDARNPSNGFYEAMGGERIVGATPEDFHGACGWRDLCLGGAMRKALR